MGCATGLVALHSDIVCVCVCEGGVWGLVALSRAADVSAGMRSRRAGLVTDEGRVVGDALAVCDAFERRAGGLAVAADGLAADGRAAAHLAQHARRVSPRRRQAARHRRDERSRALDLDSSRTFARSILALWT